MQQLSELRYAWSSVQHQRETLQTIYSCHSELVKSLASNPMRYSPVFHTEDFFDRYSDLGQYFDGAHISFSDVANEPSQESYGHDLYAHRASNASVTSNSNESNVVGQSKRKQSSSAGRKKHLDLKLSHRNSKSIHHGHPENTLMSPNDTMSDARSLSDQNLSMHQQQMLDPSQAHSQHNNSFAPQHNLANANGNANQHMPSLTHTPFSPPYAFATLQQSQETYDPMFGMPQMGWATNVATPNNLAGMTPTPHAHNGNTGEAMTPGARSNGESVGTEGEKDPFLSLLEQLAENEHSRGGPSELDFFLGGGVG